MRSWDSPRFFLVSLTEDWLEFLLTVVLFVGLLSSLVGGVIASWRS